MLFDVFVLGLCLYVVGTWVRWFRTDVKIASPRWRSGITMFGFLANTVSVVTVVPLMFFANSSSYILYHPTAQLASRIIFTTSLLAMIAGIVGIGELETPTLVCSLTCLLILFIHAFAA